MSLKSNSLVFSLLACLGCGGESQPEPQGDASGVQPSSAEAMSGADPLTVQLSAGDTNLNVVGTGQCRHAAEASIYNRRASMWMVEQTGGNAELRSLNLTVWRAAQGGAPDQFSLVAQVGEKQHRIDTVMGSQNVGSGRVTMHPQAEGARFEISGMDQDGITLRVTLQCTRFDGIEPAGG